jgi:hypothetical protein
VSYRDPVFEWNVRYPRWLRAGRFIGTSGRAAVAGGWIANFDADISGVPATTPGHAIPNMTRLRSFPAKGVALAIWYGAGGIGSRQPLVDTPLPITPDALHVTTPYVGGAEPDPRYGAIANNDTVFAVAVWIGHDASPHDRDAIWRTLASLRFPPHSQKPNGVLSGSVVIEGGPPVTSSTGGTDIHPLRHARLIIKGTTARGVTLLRHLRADNEGDFTVILPPGRYTATALAYGPASRPLSSQPHSPITVASRSFLYVRLTGHVA